MRSTTILSCLGALALIAGLCGGAKASDLADCANVKDDAERLACYDLLAKESLSQEGNETTADASDESAERKKIILRCREEMAEHGSALVRYCAEKDIAAYRALQRYPLEHRPFVERCAGEMSEYGWNMVKYCADKDIDAEQALSDMLTD